MAGETTEATENQKLAMYSPKVIDAVINDFELSEGWRPIYHTLAQIQEFNDYIDSIVDIDSNARNRYIDFKPGLRLTENRKKEIRKWIKNEQFLCFADASYFETRYAYVCDQAGEIYKFTNRKSQEVFDRILEPFDEDQVAIELFCLKARQIGISTKVVLKFLHRLMFIPHTQGVQASVDADTTALLSRMFETCSSRLPFWLPPSRTSTKATAPQWANGSIMSLQSGSQAMGIAQGWTPTLVHISEVADIPRPKKVLEEGLFPAVHSSRKLFMVLEGTGSDSTSWQANKWRYYKANWGKGGRFLCVFIPWCCASDLYPLPDWIRKNPIPERWEPMEETKRMRNKAELFIRSTDYLSRIMGARWTMPREQQWYWETKYREAAETHTLKTFLSQYPVSDEEALQSKHDRVFSDEVIDVIGGGSEREYQAYAVTGRSVMVGQNDKPYEPDIDTIDYSKERIEVEWRGKDGHVFEWELIPLKEFDDEQDTGTFNKLLVFKPPKPGVDYSIGIDTADGLGNPDEDRSVATVTLNRHGNQRDEQVAEFVSNIVNPPQMVSIAACLGAWYGQWHGDGSSVRPHTKDPRGVKFIIEQRERYGDDCQFQLKLMGFFFQHQFIRYDDKKVEQNAGHKIGWFSNAWSRPLLLNRFVDAINGGWYVPKSPMLIRQLSVWVRKTGTSGKTRLDHESGKHDDNIMGAAMSYFTRHAFDVLAERAQSKYQSINEETAEISLDFVENTITI